MCGIVGYTGSQNAAPVLLEGLEKLEYRGYDSAGVAVLEGEQVHVCKVTGRIAALREKTADGRLFPGVTGIGHTRWATHGAPTDTNAHPHTSSDGRFAVVHNGIIENYMELRQELTAQGFRFESETDTEVAVHLVERYYQGDPLRALMRAAARLRGSYALGLVCAEHPGRLFGVREASPLILGLGAGECFFASDVTALVSRTRNVIYLEDGQFAELTPESVRVFDCTGREIPKKISRVTWDIQAAEKGGYEHFMLKEILEQPRAVKSALAPRLQNGQITLECGPIELEGVSRIVITACGSAYYAGCAGKYAIEQLCRIPVQTELASELRYADPLIGADTLVIVLSQSGETADTIAAMRECRSRGARVLAIVNVVGSTVAKTADYTLYTYAGPEIAVATTKGYTTQLAVLYLFAVYAARQRGTLEEERCGALIRALEALPKQIQQALDMNPQMGLLAEKYHAADALFFIGRNSDYAVALEGALKMKEISYIHSESYAAGELKHGTIALIHEGQPVIALCCNEAVGEKTMSNIVEVKARGAEVMALEFRDNARVASLAEDMLFLPRTEPLFCPAVEIVPLQMLAYLVARANGCDIDKPKNLAKSVTVE